MPADCIGLLLASHGRPNGQTPAVANRIDKITLRPLLMFWYQLLPFLFDCFVGLVCSKKKNVQLLYNTHSFTVRKFIVCESNWLSSADGDLFVWPENKRTELQSDKCQMQCQCSNGVLELECGWMGNGRGRFFMNFLMQNENGMKTGMWKSFLINYFLLIIFE